MSGSINGTFATRREAEMAVERLVQEFGVDRSDITVETAGDENSAGEEQAGSDTEAGGPSPEDRDDAPLDGAIAVFVDAENDETLEKVRAAFAEFGGEAVEGSASER